MNQADMVSDVAGGGVEPSAGLGSTADTAVPFPFPTPGQLDMPKEFEELRAHRPVQRVRLPYGGDGWLVSRYEDVKSVLADPRFSRAATVDADVPRTMPAMTRGDNLLAMDPPDHSRLRRLVAGAFSFRGIERWRPRTEQVVADLIEGMRRQGGSADLVSAFSMPLPVTVICELLGVPVADRTLFQHFSEIVFSTTAATVPEIESAAAEMGAYLFEQIAQRRKEPGDDLLSQLIAARDEDEDRLTEVEIASLSGTILVAGHETTANQMSNFVYTLLSTGLWSRLVDRPDRLDGAVEELLRFVALGGGDSMPRIATEDVQVGGRLIRAGDAVMTAMISANFDAAVFDRADVLDLDRTPNPHVAFGHGPHFCLGAQLARMELQVGLAALLRAFPGLRFTGSAEDVPWRVGSLVRGPKELLLSW